ncbi:MAG: type II toxin-antitoxin system HicA family toxin [Candidatus Paceibacterota bacterium]|jgi:hypothetical protein
MKKLVAKTTDCSCKDILSIANKSGFLVQEGAKHSKIKNEEGNTITIVPRHNKLDRGTAKGILNRLKEFGADIDII